MTNETTTLQKLNWLSQRGYALWKKGSGKVIHKIAPYAKPLSINDAINLEERCEVLWQKVQKQ